MQLLLLQSRLSRATSRSLKNGFAVASSSSSSSSSSSLLSASCSSSSRNDHNNNNNNKKKEQQQRTQQQQQQQHIQHQRRCMSYYVPTLTERRMDEVGSGGRGSSAGTKVAIFGGSGFLGKYVCADLGMNGYMAYLANRGDDMEMRHLKVNFELGRCRYVFYSPRDIESMKDVIADADIVINLIGKYYESGQPIQTSKFPYISYQTNYSFHDTNVIIPQTLAELCRDMQVDHFIHVSSASASPTALSEWSRTKYEGEQAIKEIYPWATIIRPTQLYGKDDRLLHWFARCAQWYRRVPLVDGGDTVSIQPVWVGDVSKTILHVCDDPTKFEGKQIDCFGPTDYTYLELANFVNDITGRDHPIIDIPRGLYRQMAQLLQYTRYPLITPDLVDIWSEDFVPTYRTQDEYYDDEKNRSILTMKDLGIIAQPIEKDAFEHLVAFRVGGHFHIVKGYH